MKSKSVYTCKNCGCQSPRWMGKCPDCGEWDTFEEEITESAPAKKSLATKSAEPARVENVRPVTLKEVKITADARFTSGISELDRVLGGGIVEGSLVLVGGEPGIGKSTLLLQICQNIPGDVLYVSGEESASQIKIRAKRLKVDNPNLSLLCTTDLSDIIASLEVRRPKVAIIDSVQTVSNPQMNSAPGTVSQIKEVTMALMRTAKSLGITVFIVGHVTKEGAIAGPRILEHMVDCVLYFEGDNEHIFRLLRAVKNRFGSTNEVGVFQMEEDGLEEVSNPSLALFEHKDIIASGNCITCTIEGSRPFLTEIQALCTPTFFPVPRRTASGTDYNRMVLLMAVLEKRLKISLSNYDAYVNIAGGMRITEPAADLGIAMAIYSNYKDIVLPPDAAFMGEIGLSGEIRPVSLIDTRVKEAKKLGMKKIIVPYANLKKCSDKTGVIGVKSIADAVRAISNS